MSAPPGDLLADVIVVAAGRSTRMDGVDKLTAEIGGRPLVAWTVASLAAAPSVERIALVAAPDRVAEFARADWLPGTVAAVVPGGTRRQESVAAGFAALDREGVDEDGAVLVHDAARPLVSVDLVGAVVAAVAEHGAAVPVVPVAETLKRVEGDRVVETVDRDGLATAQTPQGVRRALLREAYRRYPPEGGPTWTDEASLLEACSIPVHVVDGDPGNIKVTVPADLARVAQRLAGPGAGVRTGIGRDSHPFGPGRPLALGGIEIADAPRLHGHSDGDVAAHAVADALLGAAGLGDLGRLFPADARTPTGIAGRDLVAEVRRRLEAAGWRAASVDLTIVAGRPRLAGHLDAMRAALAAMLDLEPGRVSVKASSGNLDGAEGAGRAVSAIAIATVEAIR